MQMSVHALEQFSSVAVTWSVLER